MTKPRTEERKVRHRIATLILRLTLPVAVFLSVVSWGREARAYGWMIRHEYSACTTCHADPSGGGLLTAYGRAQGEVLLRTRYGADKDEEPGRVAGFLFGAFEVPESLLLGGDIRSLVLVAKAGAGPADTRLILMQADVAAQLSVDRFRANGSVGFAHEGALGASVTRGAQDRLVSRQHWVGVDLGAEREVLVRAGRMNLPYGLRSIEHTLWVRSTTRTDVNAAQQHGAAISYNGEGLRGELMLIAGNFQLSPDALRERGYSAYFEYAPATKLAVGISSLVTHSEHDVATQRPTWRHAHGLFGRYSPKTWLVLSAEGDMLLSSRPTSTAFGYAGMLQADFEPVQGVHLMTTAEVLSRDASSDGASLGAWAGAAWFFAPHADVRVDGILQSFATGSSRTGATSFLAQFHLYL